MVFDRFGTFINSPPPPQTMKVQPSCEIPINMNVYSDPKLEQLLMHKKVKKQFIFVSQHSVYMCYAKFLYKHSAIWLYMLWALYKIIACDCTATITHNRKMNKCSIVMQFLMCIYFGSIKTINLK